LILYINALGFSEYDTKEKAEKLVSSIINDPTTRYISNYSSDEIKVEYYKEYGENFGLLVRGTLNENEELAVNSLIPYSVGRSVTDTHEIDVVKGEQKDTYNVFCEESKTGTPISFFLQNIIDYLEIERKEDVYIKGVRLIAFSIEGTIIFPIEKDEMDILIEEEEISMREVLLQKAREGNEDAIMQLEEEALEASEILQERLKNEDLLSVLEGFFVPIEDSEDIYSILGNIEEVDEVINQKTGEKIYVLKVKCMNINLDIWINEKNLIGKPYVGMRFKGTSWVHGLIDFEYNDIED